MSLVHECAAEHCTILTMGQFCVEHEKDEALDDALPIRVTESQRAVAVSNAER